MTDKPRKLLDKEIAGELSVHPKTIQRWKKEGLRLPRWPRTMGDSVKTIGDWINSRPALPRAP